jgi:hypothetical protein
MAASKSHMTLFFETFLTFNLARYASNPTMLALFTGLVQSDVVFGAVTRIDNGVERSTTVLSTSRHFSGIAQTWTPAPAETQLKLYTLVNPGAPLVSVAELANQTVAGLYSYLDGTVVKVGVVIDPSTAVADQSAAIGTTIQNALIYALDSSLITVASTGNTVLLDGDTFNGTLTWAEGTALIMVIPPTDYGVLSVQTPVT